MFLTGHVKRVTFNWTSVIMSDFFSSFDQIALLFLKRSKTLMSQKHSGVLHEGTSIF